MTAPLSQPSTSAGRSRVIRAEKIILLCWGLIALKHVAIIWAVHHYAVPFHQLWINFPTFLLGLVATWAYYARD